MAANLITFEAGMKVDLSDYALQCYPKFVAVVLEKVGSGPYEVTHVKNILDLYPCDCKAGQGEIDGHKHDSECRAKTPLKDIDHHQWVIVKTKEGKYVFSGAYLKVVEAAVLQS